MVDDRVAAEEIGRQMARLRGRVALRGVMGYLDESGERKDVNKLFLNNTVRSVDAHNRRHEEAKCWKAKELEEKLERRRGRRSRSRSHSPRRTRRHRSSRSRSRSRDRRRRRRSSSRSEERRERSRRRSRSRGRRSSHRRTESPPPASNGDSANEREYWAKKKAEKTKKIWEGLHAGGSVSVQNAPAFVSDDEDSSDGDVKVRKAKQSRKSKK